MRILITNDDGVFADGLLALKQALDPVAEVTVLAPEGPRSACGHSITLHKPLRLVPVVLSDGSAAWASNGTPSDCVTLALLDLMRDNPPDLVFSGINQGPNLGWDLTYSGTVSAAMEAAIAGVPAVALSLAWRFRRVIQEAEEPLPPINYSHAAAYAVRLAAHLMENPLPEHVLLNVNVPHAKPTGVRLTRQGVRRYPGKLEKRVDPMGRVYFWLGGDDPVDVHDEETDVTAIADGCISVTPVQLDLTDHGLLRAYQQAPFPEF
ncbi:MAG: surE [Armatimonadetes bacterium]|jgi:5'-nucleotidase|nr:surE [Armatimonadota bacterium]